MFNSETLPGVQPVVLVDPASLPGGFVYNNEVLPGIQPILAVGGSGGGGGGTASSPVGNTLFVDAVNGNDSSGVRGRSDKPFLTLGAAKTAAASGDTIMVRPGAYTITAPLAKNGVNWNFTVGSSVSLTTTTETFGIWDDGGAAMVFSVSGNGDFSQTTSHSDADQIGLIRTRNSASVISLDCRDLLMNSTSTGTESITSAINGAAGELYVRFRKLRAPNKTTFGVMWENGRMHVHGESLISNLFGIISSVNSAPTGDCYIAVDDIQNTDANGYAVDSAGLNGAASMCVEALTIRGASRCVTQFGSNRLHVKSRRFFGAIQAAGFAASGQMYVVGDKISAVSNGDVGSESLIQFSGATQTTDISITHWDPAGFTGEMVGISGGTNNINGGRMTGVSASKGISVSGGVNRIQNMVLNTAANSTTSPITKTGGTLVLANSTLVSNGSAPSVAAPTAQTVVMYNAVANNDVAANVTVNGLYTIGAYVQ